MEIDMATTGTNKQSYRSLWVQVVLQARDDIDTKHYRSHVYHEAVAFFTHDGPWGQSRQEIADRIDLHRDDLKRLGRAAIKARHARDGAPPVIERETRDPEVRDLHDRNYWGAQFLNKKTLEAVVHTVPEPDALLLVPAPVAAKGRPKWSPRSVNPFDPFRMQSTNLSA
jgi:hypothetical protein